MYSSLCNYAADFICCFHVWVVFMVLGLFFLIYLSFCYFAHLDPVHLLPISLCVLLVLASLLLYFRCFWTFAVQFFQTLPFFVLLVLFGLVCLDCCLVLILAWLTFHKPWVLKFNKYISELHHLCCQLCVLGTNCEKIGPQNQFSIKVATEIWLGRTNKQYSNTVELNLVILAENLASPG